MLFYVFSLVCVARYASMDPGVSDGRMFADLLRIPSLLNYNIWSVTFLNLCQCLHLQEIPSQNSVKHLFKAFVIIIFVN